MYKGIIYQAINIQNKKSYIGQTIRDLNVRKREHLNPNNCNCTYFYSAIQKYGSENFKWIILGEIESYNLEDLNQQLNEAEIESIWLFRTFGSNGEKQDGIYGYNLTKGGEGGSGYECSEEVREKNRQWHLGRTGELCPNSKIIYQYDLKGNFINTYSAVSEAQRITGINNIGSCVIGKQYTAGKYYWTYEYLGSNTIISINKKYKSRPRQIGMFDVNGNLLKIYSSIKEASANHKGDINNALKKNRLTENKYIWKYLEGE